MSSIGEYRARENLASFLNVVKLERRKIKSLTCYQAFKEKLVLSRRAERDFRVISQ